MSPPPSLPPRRPDPLRLPSPADVDPRGLIGRRLDLCRRRVLLEKDEALLLAGFQRRPGNHPWIGEHVGKWLDAACSELLRTRDAKLGEKVERMVARLRAAQEGDGYLGTYSPAARWTEWDVWVHKYAILGLLAHHDATGEAASLEAARRAGELLRRTFLPSSDRAVGAASLDLMSERVSTHRGMAAGSVLVALCRLARATGDERTLEFASYVARAFESDGGPKLSTSLLAGRGVHETANAKAYEMLSCLTGLVDLARLTGDESFAKPALRAFDDIVAGQLYVTGGLSFEEYFRAPGTLPSVGDVAETCAVVTWMQLLAELYRFTGERRFLDPFELAFWNHLLAAQSEENGAFGYFTPLDGPRPRRDDLHCCGSSGPRGLSLAPQLIFALEERDGTGTSAPPRVHVNLLTDATLRTTLRGGNVTITMATDFPPPDAADASTARCQVTIAARSDLELELVVHVPTWAPRTRARGETITHAIAARGAATFELALEVVAVETIRGRGRESGRVASRHGPFVLARPRDGGAAIPFHSTSDPNRPLRVWQERQP